MLKNTGKLVLFSFAYLGFVTPALAIPQTTIQEVFIDGNDNTIQQDLFQQINFNLVLLPEVETTLFPQVQIQGDFVNGENNDIQQSIDQFIPDFLVPFATSLDETLTFDPLDDLNSVQFTSQLVDIIGNDNETFQFSEQTFITSVDFTDSNFLGIEEFIDTVFNDNLLDGIQFGIQDLIVTGDGNFVEQSITQTIETFFILDGDLDLDLASLLTDEINSPLQFSIQETFIQPGNDNIVSQSISQVIGDISEFNLSLLEEDTTGLDDFDIDSFIDTVLNQADINTTQFNPQSIVIEGDENFESQTNSQTINTIPESDSTNAILFFGILAIFCGLLRRKKGSLG